MTSNERIGKRYGVQCVTIDAAVSEVGFMKFLAGGTRHCARTDFRAFFSFPIEFNRPP
jgi:hypothetical protein